MNRTHYRTKRPLWEDVLLRILDGGFGFGGVCEMSADRELLELAAKAAGIDVQPMIMKPIDPEEGDDGFIGFMTNPEQWSRGWFDPLTDDGDALRLAVKLGMEVSATHADHMATAYVPGAVQGYAHDYAACGGDAQAATRRGIVRAAAAIGKEMQ